MYFSVVYRSVVLFTYIGSLMIGNSTYHQSIGLNKMAFLVEPGNYWSNAVSVDQFVVDWFSFNGDMNKVCNSVAENYDYFHWLKHDLWIVWGGGDLYVDGEISSEIGNEISSDSRFGDSSNNSKGGVVVKRLDKGWHSIWIEVNGCHDPTELIGGRFLEIWPMNITKNEKVIMNEYNKDRLLIYNAEHISTY